MPSHSHPADAIEAFDILNIGGGTTGLSTALAFVEQGLKVLVIDADKIGGLSTQAQPGRLPIICHYPDLETQYAYQKVIKTLFQHFDSLITLRTDPINNGVLYKVQKASLFAPEFIQNYFEQSVAHWEKLVIQEPILKNHFGAGPYYKNLPISPNEPDITQIYQTRDTALCTGSFLKKLILASLIFAQAIKTNGKFYQNFPRPILRLIALRKSLKFCWIALSNQKCTSSGRLSWLIL